MFRRFPRRGLLNTPQINALAAANQMRAAGRPAQAAAAYVQVALMLEANQHPRRAANVHAQAAHAFADAGDEAQALQQARAALDLFLQYQMTNRTPVFFANITHRLSAHGMNAAAQALQNEYGGKVGPMPATLPTAPEKPGRLPPACPKCGGPVRSDEVSWIDATSAECIYCGAILQTE